MKIKVTKQHIEDGVVDSVMDNPVALAMGEHFDYVAIGDEDCIVGTRYFGKHIWSETYELPEKVWTFLEKFDNEEFVRGFTFDLDCKGDPVEPFEFELEVGCLYK